MKYVLTVIRDVVIVQALVGFSGFVVGVAVPQGGERYVTAVGIGDFLFAIVGFFIIGCMTKTNRVKHLLIVPLSLWLSNSPIIFFGFNVAQWAFSIIRNLIEVLLGGGLSFVFVKEQSSEKSFD